MTVLTHTNWLFFLPNVTYWDCSSLPEPIHSFLCCCLTESCCGIVTVAVTSFHPCPFAPCSESFSESSLKEAWSSIPLLHTHKHTHAETFPISALPSSIPLSLFTPSSQLKTIRARQECTHIQSSCSHTHTPSLHMLWVEQIHSAALEWDNGVWLRESLFSPRVSSRKPPVCRGSWTDDLNRGPFLSDHGSQELELKEEFFYLFVCFFKQKTPFWLKWKLEFCLWDYWELHSWALVMLVSCMIVSCWQEPSLCFGFPTDHSLYSEHSVWMKGAGAGNMSSGRFSHLLRGVWFLWQGEFKHWLRRS